MACTLVESYLYACPKVGYARNRSRTACFNEGFLKQAILGSKRLADKRVEIDTIHDQDKSWHPPAEPFFSLSCSCGATERTGVTPVDLNHLMLRSLSQRSLNPTNSATFEIIQTVNWEVIMCSDRRPIGPGAMQRLLSNVLEI